jgi:serine/threonine protein kinase/Flp pilus assembly protein TadD
MTDNHAIEDQDEPGKSIPPGTVISRYRIVERIGAGGMADVYLADDMELKRRVALKFLSAKYVSDPESKARFVREAQAAAALEHPNIIAVYEVAEFKGRPFIAMQYVPGESLRDMMAGPRLSIERIVRLAAGIASGLDRAHQSGVVHRDIKPGNILLDREGRPMIADFGVAAVSEGKAEVSDESTAGTLGYMSPEQIQGLPVDPRSDLFSFGIVLYEMLTGRRPFTGEYEASIQYAVVHETPPSVSEVRPDVPSRLARIVEKSLAKDPAQRYATAAQMLHDLQEVGAAEVRNDEAARDEQQIAPRLTRVALIMLAVVVLVFVAREIFKSTRQSEPGGKKVLAVLPFENIGASEDEYFADGMTDAVTVHLAKFSDLGVIARSSSMQYKQTQKSLREIGDELGAAYVLTGTVQWDKSRGKNLVSIKAKLIRTRDERYLWAESYDRVMDNVFAMQAEIARDVTAALGITVGRMGQTGSDTPPTANLEAYDLYLRGNEYFNRSWERADIEIALHLYERAVELDPLFAEAQAMISRAHGMMYSEYYDHSARRLQLAKDAVERALMLDSNLVEGHLARGYCHYCEMDYDGALEEFALVEKLQPNNRYLYNAIGAAYRRQGKLAEAVENFITASELDPRSFLRTFDVALTYGMMRRYDDADRYLDRTILLAPDWPLAYVYRAWLRVLRNGDTEGARTIIRDAQNRVDFSRSQFYWWLARILEPDYQKVLEKTAPEGDTAEYYLHCAQMNRLMGNREREYAYADSARLLLDRKKSELEDQAKYHSQLGLAYAGLGMKDEALAHGTRAVELLPTSKEAFDAMFLLVNLAEIQMIVGETDSAITSLEHLMTLPGFVSPAYLSSDPLWTPLRDNPRFKKLAGT